MLALKYLVEDMDFAAACLTEWDLTEAKAEFFRSSSNAVYRVTAREGAFFLRLRPRAEKLPGQGAEEIRFLQYLTEQSYPANQPRAKRDGAYIVEKSYGGELWEAVLLEQAEGQRMDQIAPSTQRAEEAGALLGRLHSLSRAYGQRGPGAEAWFDRTEDVFTRLGQAEDLPAFRRLRKELEALPRDPAVFGRVHYDFEPDNLFYSPEAGWTVIDFDDGCLHWYAVDLAQSLDALEEEWPGEEYCTAFLQGYASASPLPEGWEAARPLMDRWIQAFGYARLLHCLSTPPETPPDWMAELTENLSRAARYKGEGMRSR